MLHFRTQQEFAAALDMKAGSLSDVLRAKDNMKVSNAIKDRLAFRFNVNREWLTHGLGEPILQQAVPIADTQEGVPYFDINLAETDMDKFLVAEHQPDYFVNYRPFNDCTAYLPVFGDSMYPRYASGEIIAVKEISNYNVLQWGEAYLVITDEKTNHLRSIKLVHEHPDASKLILRSSNPNFRGDTVIGKENIKAMYIIKGKITRNLI